MVNEFINAYCVYWSSVINLSMVGEFINGTVLTEMGRVDPASF